MLANEPGRLGDGLQHAGFVVGGLDGDENPLAARLPQPSVEPVEVDDAVAVEGDRLETG
jgi:hypothetical protein